MSGHHHHSSGRGNGSRTTRAERVAAMEAWKRTNFHFLLIILFFALLVLAAQ